MNMMCWFERSIHVVLLNQHFVSSLWRNELSESTSCFPPGNALDALRPRVGFIAGGIYLCGDCPEVLFQRPRCFPPRDTHAAHARPQQSKTCMPCGTAGA